MAPIVFAGAKIGIISYSTNLFDKSIQKNHFLSWDCFEAYFRWENAEKTSS
jgi:hypothetical protein